MARRRTFNTEFKTKVVLELISGKKSLCEASREYEIKDTVLSCWKPEFLERAGEVFEQPKDLQEKEAANCRVGAPGRSFDHAGGTPKKSTELCQLAAQEQRSVVKELMSAENCTVKAGTVFGGHSAQHVLLSSALTRRWAAGCRSGSGGQAISKIWDAAHHASTPASTVPLLAQPQTRSTDYASETTRCGP